MEFIEKFKGLIQATNPEGAVKTYFDGRLTQNQLIALGLGALVIFIAFCSFKKIMRLVVTVGVIGFMAANLGVASPEVLKNTVDIIKEKGTEVAQLAELSDNVKIEGESISIKLGDEWYSVSDINSYIVTDEATGAVSVTVGDKDIAITDDSILSLLKLLSNKSDSVE